MLMRDFYPETYNLDERPDRENFLDVYYELEIQKGVLFYDMDIPINMLTYLTEVKKLVDFEALKPHSLMALVKDDGDQDKKQNQMFS